MTFVIYSFVSCTVLIMYDTVVYCTNLFILICLPLALLNADISMLHAFKNVFRRLMDWLCMDIQIFSL